MMLLKIQIYSLIYSFLYGCFFAGIIKINYKIVYNSNMVLKVIGSFLFILFNVILYFIVLKYINNGILHFHFFICIWCGYYVCNLIFDKFIVKNSKV